MLTRPGRRRLLAITVPTLLVGVLAVLVAGSSGQAAAASSFPVTVHAANGAVKVESRPTAIVSLSPTATEMLYAMGRGQPGEGGRRVLDYPPNAPRTDIGETDPNVESTRRTSRTWSWCQTSRPAWTRSSMRSGLPS